MTAVAWHVCLIYTLVKQVIITMLAMTLLVVLCCSNYKHLKFMQWHLLKPRLFP